MPLTAGPSAQSTAYLSQAADALTAASSSEALYVPPPGYYAGSLLEESQIILTAHHRRLSFLRNTVLFSALAAEAYANEFLAQLLIPADADAVDRLKTPDKLLLGPRLAGLDPPLSRGAEPHQQLVKVAKTRDKLVHSRASSPSAYAHTVDEEDQLLVGPRAASDALYAVAVTMTLLEPLTPVPHVIGPAGLISEHRIVLDSFMRILGDQINAVPGKENPPPIHLLEQMRQHATH